MTQSPDNPENKDVAERHLWEITPTRDIIILVVSILLLWLVYELRQILLPVLIAIIFAYLFNPLITLVETRWRWPRPVTASLLLVLVILATAGLIAWLGPLLLQQATSLAGRLPDYLRTLSIRYDLDLENILQQLELPLKELQSDWQKILGQIFQTTGRAIGIVTTAFSMATYVVLSIALILVYFFIFAWHFNAGLVKLKSYLPRTRKARILEIIAMMDDAVANFFRGRLVIAVIMGVLLSAGWFATGVPYWFFLGMLTGFLNIVPYLSAIAWPVAVLLKYVDSLSGGGGDPGWISIALWPSVVYGVVQLLEGWILTPWIQSGGTNMNAATILIVVLIGGAVAGVWGLLFAIPVASCIKILLDELILPRIKRWAQLR